MNSAIRRILSRLGRRAGLSDRTGFAGAPARARCRQAHTSLRGPVKNVILVAAMLCGTFCPVRGLADDTARVFGAPVSSRLGLRAAAKKRAATQPKPEGRTRAAGKPYVINADLYVDMEAGTPGKAFNAGAMDAATHGNGGTWSFRRGPAFSREGQMAELTIATMKPHLTVPVSVGGVTYKSRKGDRGWAFDLRTPLRAASFKFSDPHPAVSIGFFIEYHAPPKWFYIDLAAIDAQDGDFVVLQAVENSSDRIAHVHTGDHWGKGGGSKVGGAIPLEDNKLYWVSMRFVRHGESSLALFDPVTFKQLGPTSNLMLTSNSPTYDVILGRTDNHGAITPLTMVWDDLVVDWTHAVFPLIPRAMDAAAPKAAP